LASCRKRDESPFWVARRRRVRKLRRGREGNTRTLDLEDSMLCVKSVGFVVVRMEVNVEKAAVAFLRLPRTR
jgi:hypothetical protein